MKKMNKVRSLLSHGTHLLMLPPTQPHTHTYCVLDNSSIYYCRIQCTTHTLVKVDVVLSIALFLHCSNLSLPTLQATSLLGM